MTNELDKSIAAKVMGWTWGQTGEDYMGWNGAPHEKNPLYGPRRGYFSPSTDIADAWRVVEKLEELGWLITLYSQGGCWSAFAEGCASDGATDGRNVWRKVAETAPLVICTVALVAIAGGDLDTPADA